MAVKTLAQLTSESDTVKNETTADANTATRVGTLTGDIIDTTVNRQVYAAAFTQSGSSNPTTTVYLDQVGAIVWTRSSTGTYIGTLAGAFPSGKVPKIEGFIKTGSSIGSAILNTFTFQRIDNDTVAIGTFQNGTLTDGLLTGQYIEFYVFY